MSGRFNSGFDNLIRVLFNAVDDYTPPELYNPADKVDITEAQMRERVEDVVKMFEKKISRGKSSFSSME